MMKPTRPKRFVRSHRWGDWSLVLSTRFVVGTREIAAASGAPLIGRMVEIDLTPSGGWEDCDAREAARVKAINLRVHSMSRDPRDLLTDTLPLDIELQVAANLGAELATWLLDPATEILGMVDWNTHRRGDDGGVSLRDCVIPRFTGSIPGATAADAFGRIADALGYGLAKAA